MDEGVGFQISCFEWTLGEFEQPRNLIPAGQGILAFAYLSLTNIRWSLGAILTAVVLLFMQGKNYGASVGCLAMCCLRLEGSPLE